MISMVGQRPYLILLSVLVISGFLAYGITKVSTTTSFREFLPKDSPALRATQEFEGKFGSLTELILLEADNVAKPDIVLAIGEIENKLRSEPRLKDFITGVESQASRDQTATLIKVGASPSFPTDTFLEFVRELDENYTELTLKVTGDLTLGHEIRGLMDQDNSILIPVAAALAVIVLLLVFRRLSDIGLCSLTIAFGATWALGAMGWLGLEFTMIHVVLIPLILGLGIDYSIHMLNRYYEERAGGLRAEVAVLKSTRTTGVAIALGALTTIIGFGSFMVSELPPVGTLGIFAALGIGFTFLLSITFLPAAIILRDRRGGRKIKALVARRGGRVDRLLATAAVGAKRHGRAIALGAVVVAAVCAFSAIGISSTMSFETFLPADVPSMVALRGVEEHFGGQWVIVVLAKGEVRNPAGLEAVLELENAVLLKGDNLITHSWSLARVVSETAGRIPQSAQEIEAIVGNLDPAQRAKVLSDNEAAIYFFVNARTDKDMADATGLIRDRVRERMGGTLKLDIDGEPAVGGEAVIIADLVGMISAGVVRTTVLALLLCLVVLAIVFRSAALGVIALLPLLLTVSWELGALRALGWSLDVLTMGISALIIGIGIDYSIHLTHRFREEGRRGLGLEPAMRTAVRGVGTALLAAAATTIGVFGVLALSRMPAISRFGTLTALVISFALLAALFVLPSVLVVYASRRERLG